MGVTVIGEAGGRDEAYARGEVALDSLKKEHKTVLVFLKRAVDKETEDT
jgi:hypothetical protein